MCECVHADQRFHSPTIYSCFKKGVRTPHVHLWALNLRYSHARLFVRELCAKLIRTCTYTHASMRNVHMQHGKCVVGLCNTVWV